MKTARVILLALAVLLLPVYAHAAPLGSARISFLEGDVQVRTTESGDWGRLTTDGFPFRSALYIGPYSVLIFS